jgi:hypothetical protein
VTTETSRSKQDDGDIIHLQEFCETVYVGSNPIALLGFQEDHQ